MATPSHHFDVSIGDLTRRLLPPLLGVALLAAILHAVSFTRLLPDPVPADLDRTLLTAKVELASGTAPASVVLLGDSSCMMDVDAPELTRQLGRPVLNLGTLSYLDLTAHTALLRHALARLPNPPGDVVLLLHPGSLLRGSSLPDLDRFLRASLAGDARSLRSAARHPAEGLLAGVVIREQIVQPWIPNLLRGDFAAAYGTTWEVRRRVHRQSGTLLDPTRFDAAAFQGRYEFRLHPRLEPASREFRLAVPSGTRLWVGLTPLPESLALSDHAARIETVLGSWAAWLQPDRVLNLPSAPTTLSAEPPSVAAGVPPAVEGGVPPPGISVQTTRALPPSPPGRMPGSAASGTTASTHPPSPGGQLPTLLPDAAFATITHLNAQGVADYTALLASELRR
jgi:hypothetical protein